MSSLFLGTQLAIRLKEVVQSQAVLGAALERESHGGIVGGKLPKVTWDVLPCRLMAMGAHVSEQVLVWPPGWAELGPLWWTEAVAKVLVIGVSLESSVDTLF